VQEGQSVCLPVSLASSVAVTNLGFTLAYPGGFLTNWTITASNLTVGSATAQTVDSSNALFNVGLQSGQALLGSNVIGSICVDALPGASFGSAPLAVADMGTATADGAAMTNVIGQFARVVVVKPQPQLEVSLTGISSPSLTIYGTPGLGYDLLTTTNLLDQSFWSSARSLSLTDYFQVIALGGATNQMQFFKLVQPQTDVYASNVVGYVNVTLYPGFNLIADQLQSTDNSVGSLLNDSTGIYDSFEVFKWTASNYQVDVAGETGALAPNGWDNGGVITLNPGEAAWVTNPRRTNFTITFVGTVPQGTVSNTFTGGGTFTMAASVVPQAGDMVTNLGYTNYNSGDRIYVFDSSSGQYTTYTADFEFGSAGYNNQWDPPGDPILTVGQGFWYQTDKSAPATTWTRSFSIGN